MFGCDLIHLKLIAISLFGAIHVHVHTIFFTLSLALALSVYLSRFSFKFFSFSFLRICLANALLYTGISWIDPSLHNNVFKAISLDRHIDVCVILKLYGNALISFIGSCGCNAYCAHTHIQNKIKCKRIYTSD